MYQIRTKGDRLIDILSPAVRIFTFDRLKLGYDLTYLSIVKRGLAEVMSSAMTAADEILLTPSAEIWFQSMVISG